jgi:hypothetical protein
LRDKIASAMTLVLLFFSLMPRQEDRRENPSGSADLQVVNAKNAGVVSLR